MLRYLGIHSNLASCHDLFLKGQDSFPVATNCNNFPAWKVKTKPCHKALVHSLPNSYIAAQSKFERLSSWNLTFVVTKR